MKNLRHIIERCGYDRVFIDCTENSCFAEVEALLFSFGYRYWNKDTCSARDPKEMRGILISKERNGNYTLFNEDIYDRPYCDCLRISARFLMNLLYD